MINWLITRWLAVINVLFDIPITLLMFNLLARCLLGFSLFFDIMFIENARNSAYPISHCAVDGASWYFSHSGNRETFN